MSRLLPPGTSAQLWDDQPSLEFAQDIVVTRTGQVLTRHDAVLERGRYPTEAVVVTQRSAKIAAP